MSHTYSSEPVSLQHCIAVWLSSGILVLQCVCQLSPLCFSLGAGCLSCVAVWLSCSYQSVVVTFILQYVYQLSSLYYGQLYPLFYIVDVSTTN